SSCFESISLCPPRLFSFFSYFLSIIPHPPISTLFPYTTLFRSRLLGHRLAIGRHLDQLFLQTAAIEVRNALAGGQHLYEFRIQRDRKSTRLNSSHVSISYAVFCLKKKKTTP